MSSAAKDIGSVKNFEEGLSFVNSNYVQRVINYLEHGQIEQTFKNYIQCYS